LSAEGDCIIASLLAESFKKLALLHRSAGGGFAHGRAAFPEVAYAACNERYVRALEGGLNTRRAENRTASDIIDLPVANG
jgi:hypothetical protein